MVSLIPVIRGMRTLFIILMGIAVVLGAFVMVVAIIDAYNISDEARNLPMGCVWNASNNIANEINNISCNGFQRVSIVLSVVGIDTAIGFAFIILVSYFLGVLRASRAMTSAMIDVVQGNNTGKLGEILFRFSIDTAVFIMVNILLLNWGLAISGYAMLLSKVHGIHLYAPILSSTGILNIGEAVNILCVIMFAMYYLLLISLPRKQPRKNGTNG